MHSTHEADIDIDGLEGLPQQARTVHLIPNMTSTLISIGVLCDAGLTVHFHKHRCFVRRQDKLILFGKRSGPGALWELTPRAISPTQLHQANMTHRPAFLPSSIKSNEVVRFHHAALGSPALSTLIKAITKGYVHGFPGLSAQSLRNHPPFSTATVKGHQDLTRKNVQSTKPKPTEPSEPPLDTIDVEISKDFFPERDSATNIQAHMCMLAINEVSGQIYTDQTGKLPVPLAVLATTTSWFSTTTTPMLF